MNAKQRRDYMRGYRLGRRNEPFQFLPNTRPFTTRGWGAGQEYLHKLIGAW